MYFWAFLWLYWRDSLRDDRKLDKRVIFDFDCRFKLDPLTFWGMKDTHLIFFLHPGAQNVQPNAVKYPRCYKTVVVCGVEAAMWRLWVRRWMKSNLAFFFLRRKCRCLFHKSFINYNKSSSCWYTSHVTFLLLLFLTLSWLNVLIICSLDSELFLLRCVSASARPPTINASSVDSLIFRSIRLADVKSVSQLTRVITVMRPRKGFRVWAQFSE